MRRLVTLGVIVLASPLIAIVAIYAVLQCRDGLPLGLGEQYPNGE